MTPLRRQRLRSSGVKRRFLQVSRPVRLSAGRRRAKPGQIGGEPYADLEGEASFHPLGGGLHVDIQAWLPE